MTELYLLLALPFLLGGVIILSIADSLRRDARRRRQRACVPVDAKIVDRLVKTIYKLGQRRRPQFIYEFSVKGITQRAEYPGLWSMKPGDTVRLFYDPDYPEIIYIPKVRSCGMTIALYFIGAVWTAGGIMLLILGVLGIK